ncbi:MAG: 4Fe-4S binding protein, partial [Planctomycetota bacterium]
MRITTVRIIVQTVVLALFLSFVLLTTFRHLDDLPGLRWVVSKFLEVDPLVALATAITTHTVYKGLIWSLVILIPTLFLGRIFCNWICPYGIIHQFIGWVFNTRGAKARIESNRYRGMFAIKYYVLIGMLVACLFGSLQIGLLDPIVFVHRAFSINVVPTFNMPAQSFFGDYKLHQLGWFVGGLFLFFVGMNLVIPRFFCRVICPLGALLGVLSRFAFWRIERDPKKCTDCDLCLQSCEGASDPHT